MPERIDGSMDMQSLMLALDLAWKGMLAIFVVIIAIYICVSIMLRATKGKKDKN